MAPNDTGSDEGRATSDKLKRSAEVAVARACGAPQSAGATFIVLGGIPGSESCRQCPPHCIWSDLLPAHSYPRDLPKVIIPSVAL